jgi:hypothetical protein
MFWVFNLFLYLSYVPSLVIWPKCNYIAVIALDLKSAYEGEYMIFGLLSQADLAQNDVIQFHSFTCKW